MNAIIHSWRDIAERLLAGLLLLKGREAASGRVQPFSTIATIGAERREHCAAPLSWAGRRVCALPHGPGYHYGFEKRPIVRLAA
jgi:hypothetical protein